MDLPAETRAKIDKKTDQWLEELKNDVANSSVDKASNKNSMSGKRPDQKLI